MQYDTYEGIKWDSNESTLVQDNLSVEHPLQILINGKPFSVTMRTPGDDEDLILGLLFTEDILSKTDAKKVSFSTTKKDGEIARNIDVKGDEKFFTESYMNSRSLLSVTSCGICGKKELIEDENYSPLNRSTTIKGSQIKQLFERMNKNQKTFNSSGGSHASAAFNLNGDLLAIKEDIGRHNAVDKTIGNLIKNNTLKEAKILTLSGRISYELITKAFIGGFHYVAAVSAPSSLAVDLAKELGICLIGFCRDNRLTVYSNPHKIELS